jgi:hypothetical protein
MRRWCAVRPLLTPAPDCPGTPIPTPTPPPGVFAKGDVDLDGGITAMGLPKILARWRS